MILAVRSPELVEASRAGKRAQAQPSHRYEALFWISPSVENGSLCFCVSDGDCLLWPATETGTAGGCHPLVSGHSLHWSPEEGKGFPTGVCREGNRTQEVTHTHCFLHHGLNCRKPLRDFRFHSLTAVPLTRTWSTYHDTFFLSTGVSQHGRLVHLSSTQSARWLPTFVLKSACYVSRKRPAIQTGPPHLRGLQRP
jgi:hypothetical protein